MSNLKNYSIANENDDDKQENNNNNNNNNDNNNESKVKTHIKVYKKIKRTSNIAMSVFGKAPTLEMMRKMNQKSGSKESLFRGAEFWYTFRLYYPYIAPISFLFGLIVSLTAWNTIEGHMIVGGLLSLVSCLTVCASYVMIMPWRKHPSTIVLYRAISDIFFSFAIILMAIDYHVDNTNSCGGFPEFIHFFLLAGEGWLTTIALDLYFSLTNPFTSYKGNMKRYHILVWFFTVIITFALYNQPSCQARVQGGLCWLRINGAGDSCLWGYYLFWIVCMYGFQLGTLVFAYNRLKKGLPLTFEIRKKCAIETFKCLSSFGIYLIVLTLFFIILVSSHPVDHVSESWITFSNVFLYFVACRGYVDGLVWFNQHDFARDSPAVIISSTDNILQDDHIIHEVEDLNEIEVVDIEASDEGPRRRKRSGSITTKLEAGGIQLLDAMNDLGESAVMSFDEADLSPQVNMALRQQIVKYVTMGVAKATSGDYHPDNRHSVNEFEDAMTWFLHSLRDTFFRKDPVLSELKVTQFMLDDEHPFKEFAPDMFAELRKLEGIDNAQYLAALGKTEKEQLSEGASGAFMFFCGGMEYIVKTIKPAEANVLHRSLRHYLAYLKQNPKSLLVRFLGSYSLGVYAQTFHFVVMRNIFEPGIDINERFDIKGSWVNRNANPSPPNKSMVCRHCNEVFTPAEKEKCSKIVGVHEGNVVLKDNDLRTKISLQKNEAVDVLDVIKRDSDLLAQMGVLDYSLIIGVKKQTFDINLEDESNSPRPQSKSKYSSHPKKVYPSWKAHSISGPAIYYMGIIDFLQEWNLRKRVERAMKIYIHRDDPQGVSVMRPLQYRDRFQKKMIQIFDLEDYDEDTTGGQRGSASLRSPNIHNQHQHPHAHSHHPHHSPQPETISGTVLTMLHLNKTLPDEIPEVELSVLHHENSSQMINTNIIEDLEDQSFDEVKQVEQDNEVEDENYRRRQSSSESNNYTTININDDEIEKV